MVIAIDGPAGAGKSTIAKIAAKNLDFIYVDTGALYRSIALYCLENDVEVENEEALSNACENIQVELAYEEGVQHVYLNSKDVSTDIRKEEVGKMASKVATKKVVRDKLLALQRNMAATNNVIMDGRDIGTFVLPNAEVKIYLTATSDERARRRVAQLVEKGENPDFDVIKKDIEDRDYQDMHRDIAPLKQAEDAIYLDTSDMTIDEVVEFICNKAK